jgi:hypothetical protein
LRLIVLTGLVCACALAISCGGPATDSGTAGAAPKTTAAPTVPDDIAAVARGAFGSEGEALAWGDLALAGKQQVLIVSRVRGSQGATGDEIYFTRMTVAENADDKWTQVLLCDEHLKNPSGYLGGIPRDAISRWKLSFVKDPAQGLVLSITPMDLNTSAALGRTVRVRWNPKAKRYQSLDANSEHFLAEGSSNEIIQRPVMR